MKTHIDNKFPKRQRLHLKKDFARILKYGKKTENQYYKIYFMKNYLSYSRLGIIIPRKYGKAVKRNYAKRVVREIFRFYKNFFTSTYDIVVYIKPENIELKIFTQKKRLCLNFS